MTFAPSLTWMHLLPGGANYSCTAAPAWLVEKISAHSREGGPSVDVQFDQDLGGWTGADALAAINCRRLDGKKLQAAGYQYIRGFAAIPNLANARWFIPLDSGAVSSSAFKLYSPTKLSAQLKRSAIQTLARTGLPVWYRDSVWIIQKDMPALERKIAEAFDGKEIRLALSAGAPEPARNRKASAAVLALNGEILGFAKISGSPLARQLLQQEASFLSLLSANSSICDSVPKLLGSGEIDDRFVMTQSPVNGSRASHQLTPAHRKFLSALESPGVKPALTTSLVTSLAIRLASAGNAADLVEISLGDVLAPLADCLAPLTYVHGDFAPWNIRQSKDTLCCYDWEYGRADGLPLIDETHHELQVGYLLNNWTVEQADQRLTQIASSHTRFAPQHVAALQNVYMLDVLLRLAEEGYPASDEMVNWTRTLLQQRVARIAKIGVAA